MANGMTYENFRDKGYNTIIGSAIGELTGAVTSIYKQTILKSI